MAVVEKKKKGSIRLFAALAAFGVMLALGTATAAPTANVSITAHNLSRSGLANNLSNVRAPAAGETEICAFCHTPHGASTTVKGPLWNRNTSASTYTRYTSSSLDANTIINGFNDQPAGSSLLCMSCHDGMIALGNVNVLRGQSASIVLNNTNGGKMPAGAGVLSGYTRSLGTDLSNDHPISLSYTDALAVQDGELTRLSPDQRDLSMGTLIGIRTSGYKPTLPLEPTGPGGTGQVQCATCHDPHITAEKFLRLNRFQQGTPGANFNETTDQICLACHPKLGNSWAESAHAKPVVADEQYQSAAATLRGFPTTTKVWQAACLNCHDTHTVQGSRRLLREGVESAMSDSTAGGFRVGSAITPADAVSAIENTCYQCHDSTGSTTRAIGTTADSTVPNIRTEFNRLVRMPIATGDQLRAKKEVHDITDADFIESPEALGRNNVDNRHVECTDCHNPHRARRSAKFYGTSSTTGDGARRTHIVGGPEGNVISGVLRGSWGVEPVFGPTSSTWPQLPMSYIVKKGDPGDQVSTARTKTYMTREYQLCFKCHSNYANSDQATSFPALGNTLGGTNGSMAYRNNLNRYTNVAAEFGSVRATDPPSSGTDQGEYANGTDNKGAACGGGDCAPNGSYPSGLTNQDYNHRSWHPVMWPTGRDRGERRMASTGAINLLAPFAANIGVQTMHCSDCHGQGSSWTRGTGPDLTQTQGPHGSDDKFLLKGLWSNQVTLSNVGTVGNFCGNCHLPSNSSGFNTSHRPDDKMGGETCMWCHISVPHGWRNKAFLANLKCVGSEAGEAGTCVDIGGSNYGVITRPPYYNYTRLRISTWARSGSWGSSACGGSAMEDGCPRTGD